MLMSRIVGHRGVASLAPENTLAGIRKAAELGVAWIELDVTLLGDDQPVIFHDSKVNRTTDKTGHIKSFSLNDFREIDAGHWFSNEYHGESVPTLVEALELIKELNLSLNLELKVNRCNSQRLAQVAAYDLMHAAFPGEQLIVSSFSHKTLRYFHNLHDARTACLFEYLPLGWKRKARQTGASAIHLNANKLTKVKAQKVKNEGYELYCYTVNDRVKAKELMDWNVDGVFSDCPQDLENI